VPRRILGPCFVKSCPNRSDCPDHKRTTSQRDYGSAHRAERTDWQRLIDKGGIDCRRCGKPIQPGEPFDLGHPAPKAPEHVACNRSTMGRDRS
jgi:hypothetical protein